MRHTLTTNPHRLTLCLILCLHSLAVYSQTAGNELAANSSAWRMLSPSGYTGSINTPNAHVQSWGVANLAWTNNNPEYARSFQEGHFGSLNVGIGLLPGLEVVGRLAFDGDLNCNMYQAGCNSRSRDLSLSAKYQLPLQLGDHTRVAVGMSDFGGAATNFRQVYGVATTQWRNTELSLGYSHAQSTRALMHGVFGSARFALSPLAPASRTRHPRTQGRGAIPTPCGRPQQLASRLQPQVVQQHRPRSQPVATGLGSAHGPQHAQTFYPICKSFLHGNGWNSHADRSQPQQRCKHCLWEPRHSSPKHRNQSQRPKHGPSTAKLGLRQCKS